jgi:GNAT superfamily N-acetyltransferase
VSRKLVCHPLTPDRWADFDRLFGANGACGGCWCMFWRLPRKQFDAEKGDGNKAAMRQLVDDGEAPGLLGYLDGRPVGWVAVAPRANYSALGRSRVLKPVDDEPVWSISCLFVEKTHRRKGVSVELIRAAVEQARKRGGKIVEAYPIEPVKDTVPAAFAWTGLASAYLQADFAEVARRSPTRPVMRRVLESG